MAVAPAELVEREASSEREVVPAEVSPARMARRVARMRAAVSEEEVELEAVEAVVVGEAELWAVESRLRRSPWAEARSPFWRSVPSWLRLLVKAVEALGEEVMLERRLVVMPLVEVVGVEAVAPLRASCERVT